MLRRVNRLLARSSAALDRRVRERDYQSVLSCRLCNPKHRVVLKFEFNTYIWDVKTSTSLSEAHTGAAASAARAAFPGEKARCSRATTKETEGNQSEEKTQYEIQGNQCQSVITAQKMRISPFLKKSNFKYFKTELTHKNKAYRNNSKSFIKINGNATLSKHSLSKIYF